MTGSNTSPVVPRCTPLSQRRHPDEGMSISVEMSALQAQQWNMIRHSLWMLSAMAISGALMTMISLEFFLLSERKDPIEKRILEQYTSLSETLTELSYCLDISACLVSLAAFFSASFQVFFTLNLIQSNPSDPAAAIRFLQGTSFIRLVVFGFWFTAVILFLGVLSAYVAISPLRGAPSKGVSMALALFVLLISCISVIRSIVYWIRNGYSGSGKLGDIANYSTLV
ncbi:unnamed protein product, partial [Mesorhabditis spiculigera]